MHDPADEIVLHLDEKMNVVWHQAISVEIEGKFGFLLLDEAGELEVIIVGPEDPSTIIPASDYVIEPPPISILGFLGMAGQILSSDVLKCQESQPLLALLLSISIQPLLKDHRIEWRSYLSNMHELAI